MWSKEKTNGLLTTPRCKHVADGLYHLYDGFIKSNMDKSPAYLDITKNKDEDT